MGKEQLVKTALFKAVEELLENTSLEEVTVGQIAEKAGLSRRTFYRYYRDKYDLVNAAFYEEMVRVTDLLKIPRDFDKGIVYAMDYFQEHRAFYKKLFDYTGQNSMREFLYNFSIEATCRMIEGRPGAKELTEEQRFSIHYHTYGAVGMAVEWILAGCPVDSRILAERIFRNIPAGLKETFRLGQPESDQAEVNQPGPSGP